MIAATVGNGSARIRPNSSWPARVPSIASSVERMPRELVDVGADAEDERLAGDDHRRPVAGLELVDHAHRGLERGAAERRRLGVVLAVVDGDERDRPDARLDAVQREERVAAHTRSQTIAQPMPMPMQSAVSP